MFKEKTLDTMVKLLELGSEKIYKYETVPEDIKIVENIHYVNDESDNHLLDIVYPNFERESYAFIINIHGGGFSVNSKDRAYRDYAIRLAQDDFAVVNINFRLSKDAVFPAQIEDVLKVISFLEKEKEQYKLDIHNAFLIGDSSGAYMSAMTECIMTNPILQEYYKFHSDVVIRAVALNCGMFDFETFMGKDTYFPMKKNIVNKLFGSDRFYELDVYQYTSVLQYVTSNYCPTYIMDTQFLSFENEALRLEDILKSHGIEYQMHMFDKSDKLIHAFNIMSKFPEHKIVLEETFSFFHKYISQNNDR